MEEINLEKIQQNVLLIAKSNPITSLIIVINNLKNPMIDLGFEEEPQCVTTEGDETCSVNYTCSDEEKAMRLIFCILPLLLIETMYLYYICNNDHESSISKKCKDLIGSWKLLYIALAIDLSYSIRVFTCFSDDVKSNTDTYQPYVRLGLIVLTAFIVAYPKFKAHMDKRKVADQTQIQDG